MKKVNWWDLSQIILAIINIKIIIQYVKEAKKKKVH